MSGSTASKFPFDPRGATRRLCGVVEGVSFWMGIALPFLYVPWFVFGELFGLPVWVVAVAVGTNIVTLLLGHRHDPGGG